MSKESSSPITFVVPGQSSPPEGGVTRGGGAGVARRLPGGLEGRIKHSVTLRATRGSGPDVMVDAVPGSDVVVMEIAGGPTLVLHPATARDLLGAQVQPPASRSSSGRDAIGIPVPLRLQWSGLDDSAATRATRGRFGDVLVSAFHVVTDMVKGKAADFTAEKIAERVDGQVANGVYVLDAKTLAPLKEKGELLKQLPTSSVAGPALVFLHGTFSTTHGTFQKLWTKHPGHVERLFAHYQKRVFALDHPTLGESPIENALTLVEALRPETRLHLVTHSRGGLVAEVLAKVCADPARAVVTLEPFSDKKYETQRKALRELSDLVAKRGIRVERVVRVACPSRGTLLASKRLDAYLSVLKWSLELASIPVAPALVDFLGAVAQRRSDPMLLPGLAAQIPDSPLVRWLHASGADVSGDLRVLAGDLAGDSVTSWLKTLLSDAFYWTDNDLVVQTRGMYGGPPRSGGATFLLDQGGHVSHFNYFANERSADAVVSALTQPAPQGFREIGSLSWAGKSSTGVRGAAAEQMTGSDRPAVIVIPDVFASHLRIANERVWLSRRSPHEFHRLAFDGDETSKVEPDGLVEPLYDALSRHLAATHEVIPFAYDWRHAIERTAKLLADALSGAMDARDAQAKSRTKRTHAARDDGAADEKAPQPVRVIGHGMGGLVARALQLVAPRVWDRMLGHDGGRILLIGVPNGGSWTPMQLLSGDETFGGLLQGLGEPLSDHTTRRLIGEFPGIIQLQAGLRDADAKLGERETWTAIADADLERIRGRSAWHNAKPQIAEFEWGIPTKAALAKAVALRIELDKQAEAGFGTHASKILTVVGTSQTTPDGFEYEPGRSDGRAADDKTQDAVPNERRAFVYRDLAFGGDGHVTIESAGLPGLRSWSLDSEHRGLTTNRDVFGAYVELLRDGETQGLARLSPAAARGTTAAAIHERSRPSRRPNAPSAARTRDPFSVPAWSPSPVGAPSGPALAVTVVNGNLKFIRQPLMLGHYRAMALTGTERVVDKLIGGTMNQLIALRQYPDRPRSHKIFHNRVNRENPLQVPMPEAVIVVGLGEEGDLEVTDLVATVSHGVIAWAQHLVEHSPGTRAQFELAATLIGSGGAGISVGQSAIAVAQGVREANQRLIEAEWPSVEHLHLIELYLDRASEAWRALQVQAAGSGGQLRITETVKAGAGGLRRPLDSSYRGADYDFVTALTQRDVNGDPGIAYRLDTKRARAEVHASSVQGPLLSELVLAASNDRNADAQIGRTLFQLLIPPQVEPFLGGTTSVLLEVDSGSAGIPWELLDTSAGTRDGADTRPWSIRTKLLRKLRLDDFRTQVVDADAEAHVLVIGDPKCDATRYPRLDAAREEARAVVQQLVGGSEQQATRMRALPPERVKALIAEDADGADARTVMNAVLERDWRIVHIAAHGEPPEKIGQLPVKAGDPPQQDGNPRGVVLSNNTFLGPHEINKMRVVPELVFVNCCHLAARNAGQLLEPDTRLRYDRARFAAGVAESLINIGVRCVIAAGWAVDDEAAKTFARTFYERLLDGEPFIEAVAAARIAAHAMGGNTWAAYQCYGDPNWTFRWATGDAQRPTDTVTGAKTVSTGAKVGTSSARPPSVAAEFWTVASPRALTLALETLAVGSKFDHRPPADQRRRIRYLEEQFADRWGEIGEIAEAFADAWQATGAGLPALRWYQRAVNASDGSASMRATEQFGNLRARVAEEKTDAADRRVRRLRSAASADARHTLPDAEHALAIVLPKARTEVAEALELLESLARARPTVERLSLCGSAQKRRALIERIAGDSNAETRAIAAMKTWYKRAERLARARRDTDLFYPALNRMAAELIVDANKPTWPGFEPTALEAVRANLAQQARDNPRFWSAVGAIELRLYEAMAKGELATALPDITHDYDILWERVSASGQWNSALAQLRFILPKYVARVPEAEQDAAATLLTHVRRVTNRAKRAPKSLA